MTEMRRAEDDLDVFWRIVDNEVTEKMHMSLHEYLGDVLGERDLARTPEWAESAPTTWNQETKKADPETCNIPGLLSKTVLERPSTFHGMAD